MAVFRFLVMALAMITASVSFGELGETPKDMESGRPNYTSTDESRSAIVLGWQVHYPAFGNRSIHHLGWFRDGRAISESFMFVDKRQMTSRECEVLLRPYAWCTRSNVTRLDNGMDFFQLLRNDGSLYADVRYDNRNHQLDIYARVITSPKSEPVQPQKEKKRDCVLVATENLARLEPISAWTNVLAFKYRVNGQALPIGHAVAVWKISLDGKVLAIDDDGTYELDTASTDASDILRALAEKYALQVANKYNVVLDGHFLK